ncbi:HAD family hydrolase [Paenibacillus sp. IB182496]|uniref:HAD family hydrolase n=1 Tax=Paenibacillus sabuli TaxID=2772509 RepID=A0A927GS47_9BACL|nr:HAD family hydrolase [Paenibacillus sabuli]MBD2846344.1 HAD family hydrolase [Paenibacillus sabuli]
MKRWITFDLDGTLMQNPFAGWIFPELERLAAETLGEGDTVRGSLMAEHERMLAAKETVAAYDWDAIASRLFRSWGVPGSFSIEEMVGRHAGAPKSYLLDDTVLPGLDRLRTLGYCLAAVTNGYYKYQYPVMAALGLTERFDAVITPDRAGCAKPDAAMGASLISGGRGVIAAHVGDRLDHDMVFAHAIGTQPILISRRLPDALRTLTPAERADSPLLEAVLRRQAEVEHARLAADAPLPTEWLPAAVVADLHELADALQAKSGAVDPADAAGREPQR